MNKVLDLLTNRYVVAVVVLLALIGLVRRFAR